MFSMVGALSTTCIYYKQQWNTILISLERRYLNVTIVTVIFSRMKRHDDTGTADKTSIQAYEAISFSPEDFELCNSNTLSKNQCNLKEKQGRI